MEKILMSEPNILNINQDLSERLEEVATERLMNSREASQIVKLDDIYPFESVKIVLKEFFTKSDRLMFVINKNTTLRGKVTNKVNEYKNKISLIKVTEQTIGKGEDEEVVQSLKFFNEKIDKRHKIIDSFDSEFYIYKMISEETEYLLFSIDALELEEYEIKGMKIEIGDMADIGNYTKINLQIPIIFVNTAKTRIIQFTDHKHFFNSIPKFTEDEFISYILSSEDGSYFQHPRSFERLILSFLLSTKYDSSPYPLHLLIIGQAGSGKSKVLECLHWKFQENNEITDGSCSTIKSLIPSFRSTTNIQTGDLIKSNRLCCVDEFLRILVRIPPEEREPQLAALNPLLEHKVRNFGSGNYSFKGKMTAKLITASNPVYGTSDMIRLANKIDKSFLSRLLVYYQSKEHFDYIADKDEDDLKKASFKIETDLFLAMYDYLNSFKAKFDKERITKLFKTSLISFGDDTEDNIFRDVRSIYMARYKHHLYTICDGIVKLRCLVERDSSFTATEEDYKNIETIYNIIINNIIKIKFGGVS